MRGCLKLSMLGEIAAAGSVAYQRPGFCCWSCPQCRHGLCRTRWPSETRAGPSHCRSLFQKNLALLITRLHLQDSVVAFVHNVGLLFVEGDGLRIAELIQITSIFAWRQEASDFHGNYLSCHIFTDGARCCHFPCMWARGVALGCPMAGWAYSPSP